MKCLECGEEMCLEDVVNAGGGSTIELFRCSKHKEKGYEVKTLPNDKRIICEYEETEI